MHADRTAGGIRKSQGSRYAAALSFLVLTALGFMIWGNRGIHIASLGIAWIILVAFSFLFATKFLERNVDGAARTERPDNDGNATGEQVEDLWDGLPDGYFLVPGFRSVRGTIDRLLICPKGIFTIDADGCAGEVTFDGKTLLRNGKPLERDFLNRAWTQCFMARDLLLGWGISTPLPEPVLLFPNASVRIYGKAKGVEVAGTRQFPLLLERFPNRLSATEAGRIYSRILAAPLL